MTNRVIFVGSVRGWGVVDMLFNSRICDRPLFCPVGLGVGRFLNLVIFGIFVPVQHHCFFGVVVLGGLFLVGFRAFHGLVSC